MALEKQTACSATCRSALDKKRYHETYVPAEKVDKKCEVCGKEFKGKRHQRYCSAKCREEYYEWFYSKPNPKKDAVKEEVVSDSTSASAEEVHEALKENVQ